MAWNTADTASESSAGNGLSLSTTLCTQVLCNAAKADKARLQQLEVELARFSHRAEAAEADRAELQQKLQQVQVSTCGNSSPAAGRQGTVAALRPMDSLERPT